MNKTPYELLGVSPKAPQDEIRNAYRKLAKKLHPDLNPGNAAAAHSFKEINGAYELVGTPEERVKYDRGESDEAARQAEAASRHGRRGPYYNQTQQGGGRYSFGGAGGGTHGAENYFDEEFMSSIFGHGAARGPRMAPQDERYEMEVGFKDSILGAEREIALPSGKKLRVKIPPGVVSGTQLRFAGQGGQGTQGAAKQPASDVFVKLSIRPSELFSREENNLKIELPISFSEAILGTEIKIPTIDGPILLKIPAGVSTGSKLKVSGKGVPFPGANAKRGDQIVELKIVVPKNVDDPELRTALQAWQLKHPFDPRAGFAASEGLS
jgi:DnaJ-class molecular chaperone